VPADILMKKAIIKLPCPLRRVPVSNPITFMSPCRIIIMVTVFGEKPYFLYSSPRVNPSAHL
jgi:hypothetical protein